MSLTFLHTADWQLGRPYASVEDSSKQARLQQERIACLARIANLVKESKASFVLVAGDLLDSPSPTMATVSAACSAIGKMDVPVIAIPGNHDHGGPGGPWEQDFLLRECRELAPNFQILTTLEPLILDDVVLLPAPLLRRHENSDPTTWIRRAFDDDTIPADRPRIVLAHGSVQGFSSDDDSSNDAPNQIDLLRLPESEIDYIALGDWHGTKEITPKAWYAGTPEIDRFPKGENNQPGKVLEVTVNRGGTPKVTVHRTTGLSWHQLTFHFAEEADLDRLQQEFTQLVGTGSDGALLQLELDGALSISASLALQELLDTWRARLLRLKLRNQTSLAPSEEEIHNLTGRATDPLISRVARQLLHESQGDSEDAAIARIALQELYRSGSQEPQ